LGDRGKIRTQNAERKEITMTYTKPEINALGDAARLIQSGIKMVPGAWDAVDSKFDLQPAYDLDE
jgi:hypothetical protein